MLRFAALMAALAVGAAPQLGAQAGRRTTLIDPNLATAEQLAALPHMNADLVKAIMAARPFTTMLEMHDVLRPLTPAQRTDVYRKAFVQLNLNTASKDEILLIPGVGNRMLREFEEYRPYRAIAQFRREIGKYVNDAELARLEEYVFVPIDLNTASDQDILSIPGVGTRMLHEFKEYRPYRSMAQFHREIGKYVDDKELKRLARYVEIR